MRGCLGVFSDFFIRMWQAVVQKPLEAMYLNGPRALGMWAGAANVTMCSILTPEVEAHFWGADHARAECDRMVARDVQAWTTFATTVLYFYMLTWGVRVVVGSVTHSAFSLASNRLVSQKESPPPPCTANHHHGVPQ